MAPQHDPGQGPAAASAATPFDPLGPLEPGVTLLEASAGTGKTYSITSIFVRLVIEYQIKVDEILAVTFTQAATAELTSRIRKRLGEAHRILQDTARRVEPPADDEVLRRLAEQARDGDAVHWAERARAAVEGFDRAHITTIHGFCQRMLTQHALEAQVPFGVRLIEDSAALVQEIADDFWVREVARAEPWELLELAALGVDREAMRKLAAMAIDNWEATPMPEDSGLPYDRPDGSALMAALAAAAEAARHAHLKSEVEALEAAVHAADRFTSLKAWRMLPGALDNLAQGMLQRSDLEALSVLERASLRALLPNAPLPPIVELVSALLAEHRAWKPRAEPWAMALRQALVREARSEHRKRTGERGVWTFDDLLRCLRDALTSATPEVAEGLKAAIGGRFKAVLIDEFQDTDPVQWQIFSTIFANRQHRLYLIGDPKQAIYGFRRADVMTYLAAGRAADRVHTLDRNYRSDGPLVDALNCLFQHKNPARVFAVEGIPYARVEAREPSRVEGLLGAPIRVLWVRRSKKNTSRKYFETARMTGGWGTKNLPDLVAADIVTTLTSGVRIVGKDGAARALAPSDLAVLVQRNSDALNMQEALRRAGVPAVVHGPRSVFETGEARDLLRVLGAVLDPSRMQNVRAALLTPLLGVTALALAEMEQSAARQLEMLIDRFREWREVWHKRSFIEAFRRLTSARVEDILGLEDGERRLANLLQLGELLHLAVAQKDLKPPGLVAWLERQIQRADKTDERQQVRLETDEPAVQVVTIHKAKGLEYPFVWCPFLWQRADRGGRGGRIADFVYREAAPAHAGLTAGTRRPRLHIGLESDPTRKPAHALHAYSEQAEGLRAFYVALTRAKHQVTLYGGAFWDVNHSALGYALLSSVTAHDAPSLERENKALEGVFRRLDEDIVDGLQALLPKELIRVDFASTAKVPRYHAPESDEQLAARAWPAGRLLDTFWRRTSFSGLVHEAGGESEERLQAASDEDRAANEDLFLPASAQKDVLLADLPSGRAIGNCIHKILELADFGDAGALAPLVGAELERYAVDAAHGASLGEALRQVLETPLDASGLRLCDVPRRARLPELAFVLPVSGGYRASSEAFTQRNLLRAFRSHGDPALESWLSRFETLSFSALRGFLSGSLDLAFQAPHDGRWYIIDWKSNHLGRSARDYAAPRLRAAMDQHHYHLQYHLYALALWRYLAARLPTFDLASDFGGVFYLFLRGMHPEHPLGTGIFHDRPSPALLQELHRQFRGEDDPKRRQLELL